MHMEQTKTNSLKNNQRNQQAYQIDQNYDPDSKDNASHNFGINHQDNKWVELRHKGKQSAQEKKISKRGRPKKDGKEGDKKKAIKTQKRFVTPKQSGFTKRRRFSEINFPPFEQYFSKLQGYSKEIIFRQIKCDLNTYGYLYFADIQRICKNKKYSYHENLGQAQKSFCQQHIDKAINIYKEAHRKGMKVIKVYRFIAHRYASLVIDFDRKILAMVQLDKQEENIIQSTITTFDLPNMLVYSVQKTGSQKMLQRPQKQLMCIEEIEAALNSNSSLSGSIVKSLLQISQSHIMQEVRQNPTIQVENNPEIEPLNIESNTPSPSLFGFRDLKVSQQDNCQEFFK